MNNNGHSWVTKSLVGMLWVCVLTALTMLGNNVIANDKDVERENVAIRREIGEAKTSCDENCDRLRLEIKSDILAIKTGQYTQGFALARILAIVERLEEK